ncbi:MAG TPA: TRAP transporter small permease subunit [Pseudomonadales bacterium]|jgi:TRAP-type mannitol/chloroaromatic compound transport system permease small subunit|nr:permease [Gammaproteobacteria bacterium]MDP6027416.1 TRAP transporter small permease subunit [Pseudomonadales bacterium]MDP6315098.1 TRAP transporter small permease subunit [Pseudomonadales bacterium]MDP7315890.1 TRAP transporter small permease subunit [Pseudomonadales bacterium]MDP7576819.1 TRAP transporter small permease subunit [Pseudomonadales bacterium]|tara:strand:- start:457 stop:960 length:504 start_codon:yes stop_codon:yes gene_type:complete
MNKVIDLFDRLSDMVGNLIAPITIIMMVLTCIVVFVRYLLNAGAIPIQETVVYLHGSVFMLGIAYTLKQSAHVRVDILYSRFSPRKQALVNLFGTTVFLIPFSIFLLWTSLDFVSLSWSLNESSAEPGGLPFVYLLKTLIPIMPVLLLAQGIAEIMRNLSYLRHGDS